MKRPAKVVDANPRTPRSYVVDSDGSTVRRNRRALRERSVSVNYSLRVEHIDVKVSRYGGTIKPIMMMDL